MTRRHLLSLPTARFVTALSIAAAVAAGIGEARAQSSTLTSGTDPVIVDLSVLNDGGYGGGALTSNAPQLAPGQRLMPGAQAPISRLYVQVPGGPKLRPPKRRATARVAAPASKPPKRKPAPPAKKKPQELASAAPPAQKPAKKPAAAMAPKPKPAPPPSTVAAAQPKPKPAVKKPAKKKPMKKKAPPPPPPASTAKAPATPPTTAKAPEPSPPAKTAADAQQTAAVPAGGKIKAGSKVRVAFAAQETKLSGDAKAGLGGLAGQLKDKDDLRVQLMAYAGGEGLSPSKARRVSLSRALSIRSFLIESGVRSTRIDVRALGSKTTEKPVNRVDVNVVER